MLNVNLDEEAERYLIDLLTVERTTSSELIKRLLHHQWLSLQPRKTFLERRGESPKHLLNGSPDLSDWDVRQEQIANYLRNRYADQQQQ